MPEVEVNDSTPTAESPSENYSPDSTQVEDAETGDQKTEDETAHEKETEKKEEWLDILGSGVLKMKVIKRGEPNTRPQSTDICNVKLIGKLEDGTVVEEYNSLRITLGDHEVIQGLELAITLMDVGDETIVVVGPRFAYGMLGLSPLIPPNATITYTVELLKVDLEPELDKIPFDKRKILANSKRERGNWWYLRQDSTKAIQCYRRALDILDDATPYVEENEKTIEAPEETVRDIIENRLKVYNNLAAAQLQIEAYDSALSSVENVIRCQPDNVKALFRKGKILAAKGQTDEALENLRKAFLLEPENSAIKIELSKCVKLQQVEKQHEKNLYKKMLGTEKKGDEKPARTPKGKMSSWTKVLTTAATATVMAALAVAVGYRYKNYSFL